jgi:hypothetical protein
MASNRIKASSAKELALPTSLALVSHVLSDVKQTYSKPDENPASPSILPPFRVEQTPQVFRFESTQRAHSPKDPASSSSSTTVFYAMAYPTPNVLCLVIKREKSSETGMFCSFVVFRCIQTTAAAVSKLARR